MSRLLHRFLLHGHPEDPALIADPTAGGSGRSSYSQLRARAAEIAATLPPLEGEPVAFLASPSIEYVEAFLGILLAGGIAVPLSPLHTAPEMTHVLENADPAVILVTPALRHRLPAAAASRRVALLEAGKPIGGSGRSAATGDGPADEAPALMLYTSGTTGKPKGVTLSHAAVAATCASLEEAWGWRRDDRLLHLLPLHHTHGVIVALLGGLWAGASVRFAAFEAATVWSSLDEPSVFMAVPTIYAKLMEAFRTAPPERQHAWRASAARLRLFTSGSAALPAALWEEFRAATGQPILERYGMTEIGMALSNPLDGPRTPGAVGRPLPGVTVDIVSDDGRPCPAGEPGELRVRSPQLFSGYHRDPAATAASYDREGRFCTGDTGVRDSSGIVRLLGRTSTDILKSGGYKLSALEIEDALREHPAVAEMAVIGLPDDIWGDRVTACVVLRPGAALGLEELR